MCYRKIWATFNLCVYSWPSTHCLYFTYVRKIYVRKHEGNPPLSEYIVMPRGSEHDDKSSFPSLPRSRFLDVTQRSPKSSFGGALRDIQKTAARETTPSPAQPNS